MGGGGGKHLAVQQSHLVAVVYRTFSYVRFRVCIAPLIPSPAGDLLTVSYQ
jgi:hypothetical protein